MYRMKRTPLATALLLALNAPFYSSMASAAVAPTATGSEFPVNTYTPQDQKNPVIATDAKGDYVVVWQSIGQNGGDGIYAQLFHADGTADASGEIQVAAYNPATSNSGVVIWRPSVAMDAEGDFVVAWQSYDTSGTGEYDIYARRYNADGTPAAAAFPVNTATAYNQITPSVAMDATGDFVIAWNSLSTPYSGSSGTVYYGDIYARRYSAAGTALDATETLVNNTYTTGRQELPSVAMDASGDYVIAWDGDYPGTTQKDVYAQLFKADGTANGTEIHVNTHTTSQQKFPSVAMDASGDFVVAWESKGQDDPSDTNGYGIYARRFDTTGKPTTAEIPVNTYTTDYQVQPSVSMDANGEFVVTWGSLAVTTKSTTNGEYGSGDAVDAQFFDVNAAPVGSELHVNSWTTGKQNGGVAAMDASGDFVIAWQSYGQDAPGGYGIYGQRYTGYTAGSVDLNLVVNADTNPVTAGNNFTYSLITTNKGTDYAMAVSLSEPLPSGLTYVKDDSATAGWSCSYNATTINCNRPYLAPGASSTINVTVTADTAGTLSNTVTASAAQTDANPADNTVTETTTVNASTSSTSSGSSSSGGGGSLGVFTLLLAIPLWLRRRWMR